MKKILYGICGIGNGHTYRQLPIISTFAEQGDQVMIFAYGSSYRFYENFAQSHPNVRVAKVAVPFYQGSSAGLDFRASLDLTQNQENFFATNCKALATATDWLGQPDLVISDYEPICAQYAYSRQAPLITFDQQSKYLTGTFPQTLSGQSYQDEVMRLRFFFPKAHKRIACSFFDVPMDEKKEDEKVIICPPVLRTEVHAIQRMPHPDVVSVMVYFSEQHFHNQSLNDIIPMLESIPQTMFHLFLPHSQKELPSQGMQTRFYHHGDSYFNDALATCHGIVATAGHTLLAEAMYLGIPVFALTLPIYEQLMNGYIIDTHGFGKACHHMQREDLMHFLHHLPIYAHTIREDRTILLRSSQTQQILEHIQENL